MSETQEPRQDPQEVPARGWWQALKRTRPRIKQLNLPLLASGTAFRTALAIFPTLLAVIAVYGLFASPQDVTTQVGNALGTVSPEARAAVTDQLTSVATARQRALGIGLAISLVTLLWAASTVMHNLMKAVTTGYEQEETRGFLELRGQALLLTLGAIALAVVLVAAVTVVPPLLADLMANDALHVVLLVGQFLLLAVLVVAGLAVLYRFGPANRPVGWRWASVGALVAAVIWAVGTALFALYVNTFSSYGNTYGGSLGSSC